MTQGINTDILGSVVLRICEKLEACSAELNDLDAKLGDGDLGSTLASIARALRPAADGFSDDMGEALNLVVAAISATSGSSFSAVAMTGLHKASITVKGRKDVPWQELSDLLVLAQEAMATRGGAKLGDKSVLDSLAAVAEAIAEETDPTAFPDAAIAAVDETLAKFRDRPCKIGRARLAPSRSVGHDDPGMVAFRRILEAAGSVSPNA